MRRLRLGLVGAGRRAQAHVQTILALDDRFELVAVCDINPGAAQAIAARTGASAHGDVDEFFRAGRLEAVDIVTPPDAHHVIAKAAADYRVPMLIETPIAPTRQMAELIIEAAARANIPLEVGENVWRWPAERLARQVLQSGAIGRGRRAYCLYVTGGYHAIAAFLTNVGSLNRIIAPVALTLKPLTPQDQKKIRIQKKGESLLDSDFQIQTYIAHPPLDPVVESATEEKKQ